MNLISASLISVLVATMFVTGVGLWEPGLAYFEGLLGFKATIDQLRLAALIHAGAAVLAVVAPDADWSVLMAQMDIWIQTGVMALAAYMTRDRA